MMICFINSFDASCLNFLSKMIFLIPMDPHKLQNARGINMQAIYSRISLPYWYIPSQIELWVSLEPTTNRKDCSLR